MDKLKIEYVKTSELTPYTGNAKLHTVEQVEEIKRSIKMFGMNDPIAIWKNNEIIEGHGRLIACVEMGIDEVPVIRLDNLSDEERRAYTLVHNQLTMETGFDLEILSEELENIADIDMSSFGFESDEDEEVEDEDIEEVETPEPPEEPTAKLGDIYQLGRHRLMCGDATVLRDVRQLVGDSVIHCVITDPPYNMAYEGAGNTKDRASKRIMNDKMSEEDFLDFLTKSFMCYKDVMEDGATFYSFYKELGNGTFMTAMKEAGITFKQELIWVKNQIVIGGAKYQNLYEPCLMGCTGDKVKYWNGARKQRSVIESIDLMTDDELRENIRQLLSDDEPDIIRVRKNAVNDLHPTMKPVRLIAKLMKNSSNVGQNVLDLFGGSGTTLIAAEETKRNAFIMELDPKYVDVIIKRWEDYTGEEAKKVDE